MSFGTVPSELQEGFSFRVRTSMKPRTSGHHSLSLASIGPAKLHIDGTMLIEQSGAFEEKASLFFPYGSDEKVLSMDFSAGREYGIQIDYHSHNRQFTSDVQLLLDPMEDQFQGFRFGFEEVDLTDLPSGAAGVAADCDAAIIVVGRDKEWETEGQDILSFNLPGDQVRLIQCVAAVCPRTIVLVQAGTPVNMEPWMDEVSAILYTWYQGQELGNAAADVVCGHVNPSGRLPVTFPKRIEDCPAFSSFPGEENEIHYTEGLFVGYRWWDLLSTKPLFAIGYGLSYNTFEVSSSSISRYTLVADSSNPWVVTAHVMNSGGSDLPGRQTVIAWFSQRVPRRLQRPKKQICGFTKSRPLLPGESEKVAIQLDYRAFGVFDTRRQCWVIDANAEFEILLGTMAADAVISWCVKAPRGVNWIR